MCIRDRTNCYDPPPPPPTPKNSIKNKKDGQQILYGICNKQRKNKKENNTHIWCLDNQTRHWISLPLALIFHSVLSHNCVCSLSFSPFLDVVLVSSQSPIYALFRSIILEFWYQREFFFNKSIHIQPRIIIPPANELICLRYVFFASLQRVPNYPFVW